MNLASRLESVSAARSGVVVSGLVMDDPEVVKWARDDGGRAKPITTTIKGFEDEPIVLWAVTPTAAAQPDAAQPDKAPGQPRMV